MHDDYMTIASEIRELESLLAAIPEANVIERMSFQSRLDSAKAALDELPQQITAKARLTFRGKPVFRSYGIAADFGGKAAGAFSDAFAAVAAGLAEGLCYMGPIPNRDKNQLLITGIAIGSFGFEFELPTPEPSLIPEEDTAEQVMLKIEELFRLSAEGTDDEVAEVIEEVHPRAVKKVYEFLEVLVQQHAWCGLEFADRFFRYSDYDQIKAASERLKDDNIREATESFQGEFQGVLPTGRAFEFRVTGENGLIKGKIDRSIDDPDVLNREWLHKPVTVKLSMMQVGQGRPRYTLLKLDDLNV